MKLTFAFHEDGSVSVTTTLNPADMADISLTIGEGAKMERVTPLQARMAIQHENFPIRELIAHGPSDTEVRDSIYSAARAGRLSEALQ